ncbi:MAG: DUF4197 domain-containing protein [Bacteroidia bacterium]|nr:DUF4197 domain-containing protein [Bacteroidia bacterium]
MRKLTLFLILPFLLFSLSGCETILAILEEGAPTGTVDPTLTEMSGGLKEALVQGTGFAVNTLSAEGGYLNDATVKIPFPEDAQKVANKLRDIGLGGLVDEFESRLNKGAEKGAAMALPIFKNAIKDMTFDDAKNILLGNQSAATDYFRTKTSSELSSTFSPLIKKSLDEVKATEIWTEITTKYNSIPFVKKVETDIVQYATDKALIGLFSKVEIEEKKIRDNISARKTDLLQKVFSYADRQLNKNQ